MKKLMYLIAFLITLTGFSQTTNHRHKVKLTGAGSLELTVPDSLLTYDSSNTIRFTKLTDIATKLTPLLTDIKLKVSSDDTTPGFLEDKIIEADGIIILTLNDGADEDLEIKLDSHYLSIASSSLYDGCVLSIGGSTGTFSLSVGNGLIIDSTTDFNNIVVTPINFTGATNVTVTNILTQNVTYIMITNAASILQLSSFPTPSQRRDNIFIGVVVHSDNVNVNVVNNTPSVGIDVNGQVQDIMIGLGFFNLKGNRITANGANLSIDKSVGKAFKAGSNFNINKKDPHTVSLPVQTIATFRYRNQDSSEGSDVTLIDPTTYDNAGVTTTIAGSNNQATIQRIYIFPSGQIRIQRGQEIFSNFSDAVDRVGKEVFLIEPNIEENGLLLASLVVTKGTTDLSSSTTEFFPATKFGELGSVGSSSVTSLQNAYENSIVPNILTNATLGALTVQRGTASDSDNVFEVRNGAGDSSFSVDGNGNVNGNAFRIGGADQILQEFGGVLVLQNDGTVRLSNSTSASHFDMSEGFAILNTVSGSTTNNARFETDLLTTERIFDYPNQAGIIALNTDIAITPLDEGNGIGFVRNGRDATKFGNVGLRAFDFSINEDAYSTSATRGATGEASIIFGEDNIGSGYGAFGNGFEMDLSGTYSTGFGRGIIISEDSSFSSGIDNIISAPYSFSSGAGNNVSSFQSAALGIGLIAKNSGSVWVGQSNLDYSPTAGINQPDHIMFGVGNGTILAGTPNTRGVGSDALNVFFDGTITAPSLSISEIDTAGNPALITLEYVTPTAKTGTVLDLGFNRVMPFNIASASNATTYTTTNIVIGGAVKCLINAATEPVVTGATKISSPTFQANTDMFMVVYTDDGTNVEFYFLLK